MESTRMKTFNSKNIFKYFAWNLETYFHLSNQVAAWSKSCYLLYNQEVQLFLMKSLFLMVRIKNCKYHCVKSVRIWSYSGPHSTPYLSVFSPNAGKCGKSADQNNSEYELFLRSARNHLDC